MIRYDKLFARLAEEGKSATYWLRQNGLHAATVNKLRKNELVRMDTIDHLCRLLACQPGELLEYVPDRE